MQIDDLKTFQRVCELQSFTKAARALNYVQSNVTAKVKRLENYFDTQLIYRDKKQALPTPQGSILLTYIEKIMTELTQAELAVGTCANVTFNLGSIETLAATRLPGLLEQLRILDNNCKIDITTGSSEQLIERVLHRKLEGALLSGEVTHKELTSIPLYQEKMVVITRRGEPHPVTVNKSQSIIVFDKGCFYRSYFEQWLNHHSIVVDQIMTLNTLDGILGCVQAGLGIAMIPESVLSQNTRSLVESHAIEEPFSHVSIACVYRSDNVATPTFNKFQHILRHHLPDN